jgi:hypothetical protein
MSWMCWEQPSREWDITEFQLLLWTGECSGTAGIVAIDFAGSILMLLGFWLASIQFSCPSFQRRARCSQHDVEF